MASARKLKSQDVTDNQLKLLYGDDSRFKYWESHLFNDVYLRRDLPEKYADKWGDTESLGFQHFMNTLRNLATEYKDREKELLSWSETETINNWVKFVLEALGWSNNCSGVQNPYLEQTSFRYDNKTYRTDILLVDHPKEKLYVNQAKGDEKLVEARNSVVIPVEVKYWQRLEEFRQGRNEEKKRRDNDSDDLEKTVTPNEQTTQYMEILKKDWGILTDGAKWRLFNRELSSEDPNRYYEFNLYSLIESMNTEQTETDRTETIEAAKYFYHFFSKSTLHPRDEGDESFVGEILRYSKKYVHKVEEDLKVRFVKAMNIACNGFHKLVRESGESKDLTLVRNVAESSLFNILFIKSLESRGILPMNSTDFRKISLSNIIDKIERFDPEKEDILNNRELDRAFKKGNGNSFSYDGKGTELHDRIVRLTMMIHDGGSKDSFGFEIVGFKESVFSDSEWKIFKNCKLTNSDWVRILFQLGYAESESLNRKFQQIPYSYFTPRQLGSIYESFLEFQLEKATTDMVFERKQWQPADLESKKYKTSDLPKVRSGHLFFTPDNKDRKASGSYYTPHFIVQEIVSRCLGEQISGKSSKEILKIKICDPAMGSGHFLVSALNFILRNYLIALENESKGDLGVTLPEAKRSVLHSCIFGVDINPRAVKLAKMSLWLETASVGKTLENLEDQIVSGDSLVSEFPGYEKNFDWDKVFFKKSGIDGFDAIIGNPPYIRREITKHFASYFKEHYETFDPAADIYVMFIEKSVTLLNKTGTLGFVVANKWMRANYGASLRQWLKGKVVELIDFKDLDVFDGVNAYPCIMQVKRERKASTFFAVNVENLDFELLRTYVENNKFEVDSKTLSDDGWSLNSGNLSEIFDKVRAKSKRLADLFPKGLFIGLKTGLNNAFVLEQSVAEKIVAKDKSASKFIKPLIFGKEIKAFRSDISPSKSVICIPKGWTNENISGEKKEAEISKRFPSLFSHLIQFKNQAMKRSDMGDYWWELRACDYYNVFESPKIIFPDIALKGEFAIDSNGTYLDMTAFALESSDPILLLILNSKVTLFQMKQISSEIRGGYLRWKRQYVNEILIPTAIRDKAFTSMVEKEFKTALSQIKNGRKVDSDGLNRFDTFLFDHFAMSKKQIDELNKFVITNGAEAKRKGKAA